MDSMACQLICCCCEKRSGWSRVYLMFHGFVGCEAVLGLCVCLGYATSGVQVLNTFAAALCQELAQAPTCICTPESSLCVAVAW